MSESASRSERPTQKRLQDARERGNVARSNELSGALVMLAFLVYFQLFGAEWLVRLKQLMTESISVDLFREELTQAQLMRVTHGVAIALSHLLVLPAIWLAGASMTGNLLQGTPTATLRPLTPDWSKLNPFTGLRRVLRPRAWVDLTKASLKLVLFTAIALSALRDAFDEGIGSSPGPEGTFAAIVDLGGTVILRVALLMVGLAIVDMLYTRWDHRRSLKMSKEEVKEERRQQEGDPQVKSKIRSKQLQLSRSRMMADVPDATVVVTNPTHFAIALRYVPGDTDVPRVLAKGADRLAERIREIAAEHGVPIHRDPPLARALFHSVEVGDFIPESLFRAVAEVLALVLRPRRPQRPGASPGVR